MSNPILMREVVQQISLYNHIAKWITFHLQTLYFPLSTESWLARWCMTDDITVIVNIPNIVAIAPADIVLGMTPPK